MHMILRIMLRPSHRSFAWPSQNILSRLLVIDLQAGKFRTIPAMKYRPAVRGHFCANRDRRMYQREVVRRRRQHSLAPANVRFEVVSISWETGVVLCTCTIPACKLKATISTSDTERFVVLRAVLPKSRRVLVGVQQWSTLESVVTAKRRSFFGTRSRAAGLLFTRRG